MKITIIPVIYEDQQGYEARFFLFRGNNAPVESHRKIQKKSYESIVNAFDLAGMNFSFLSSKVLNFISQTIIDNIKENIEKKFTGNLTFKSEESDEESEHPKVIVETLKTVLQEQRKEIIKQEDTAISDMQFDTILMPSVMQIRKDDLVIPESFKPDGNGHLKEILLKTVMKIILRRTVTRKVLEKVGDNIEEIGRRIKKHILPKDSSLFASEMKQIDNDIEATSQHPHLEIEIRSGDEIWIPWWLTQTYDNKDTWGNRYAMSIISSLEDKKVNPLRKTIIGQVSRSTRDTLEHKAYSTFRDSLSKITDTLSNDQYPVEFQFLDGADFKQKGILGVPRLDLEDCFKTSNVFFYLGHFESHYSDVESCGMVAYLSTPNGHSQETVSLHELQFREKQIFLYGCNSIGTTITRKGLNANVAEYLLNKGCSAFIGSMLPVEGKSATEIAKKFSHYYLIGNLSAAEALRKAKEDLKNEGMKESELAPYCLFGPADTLPPFLEKGKLSLHYQSDFKHLYYAFNSGLLTTYAFDAKIEPQSISALREVATSDPERALVSAKPLSWVFDQICKDTDPGKELKILGPVFCTNGELLLVTKRENLQGSSAEEKLKYFFSTPPLPKKIAVTSKDLTGVHMCQLLLFEKYGINKANIDFVEQKIGRLGVLLNGLVDASITLMSEVYLEKDGVGYGEFMEAIEILSNIDTEFSKKFRTLPWVVYVTSRETIENKRFAPHFREFRIKIGQNADLVKKEEFMKEILRVPHVDKDIFKPFTMCQIGEDVDLGLCRALIEYSKLVLDKKLLDITRPLNSSDFWKPIENLLNE